MTPKELAEIKARCDAATPGPYKAELDVFEHDDPEIEVCITNIGATTPPTRGYLSLFTAGTGLKVSEENWPKAHASQDLRDAEFFAHARTDVPALLAEIERLRGLSVSK